VIGGSVTALAATFFVLPVVYEMMEQKADARRQKAVALSPRGEP
jgi:Cu/Ag efflux pump CusA